MAAILLLGTAPRERPATDRCPPQPVSNAGTYDLIATLKHLAGAERVTITGIVSGAGPLTGLQVTFAESAGGQHVIALQDADFSTATDVLLRSLGLAQPTNITTGSVFQITLYLPDAEEIAVRAKSANGASVAIEACAAPHRS